MSHRIPSTELQISNNLSSQVRVTDSDLLPFMTIQDKQSLKKGTKTLFDINSTSHEFAPPIESSPPAVVYEKQSQFFVKQKWQGYVMAVHDEYFTARLSVLQGEEQDIDVDLLLEQVSDDDKYLLKPDAIFYLSIGYHVAPSSTRMSSSLLRFQRLPDWSESEIQEAKRYAKRWLKLFSEPNGVTTT